jgi:CheY-like chemotaxis protein
MEMSEAVRLDNTADRQPRALVVDDDAIGRMMLGALLTELGYAVLEACDGAEGVECFAAGRPDIVFMDMSMPVLDGPDASRRIKQLCADTFVPVIFVTGTADEDDLVRCIESGGDDFIVKPYSQAILAAKIRAMQRIVALHRSSDALRVQMQDEQALAKDILEGAVMRSNACTTAITTHLAPASTFNGDLMLSAHTPGGDLHVLLGDFTGHGLAATIGALPVAETFRAMTAKGFAPEQILSEINRKLRLLLPTGRFLAAVFLRVERSLQRISLINCGMPEAWHFGPDGLKARFPSTALPLSILDAPDYAAEEISIPVRRGERILLVSDGAIELSDQAGRMFGAEALCAAAASGLPAAIEAIAAFRGVQPAADDESLVEIHLVEALLPAPEETGREVNAAAHTPAKPVEGDAGAGWHIALELRGHALRETSPVPLLMSLLKEFPGPAGKSPLLFTALAELYNNALDHGVLNLDSALKVGDFEAYLEARDARLSHPGCGNVAIELDCWYSGDTGALDLRVRDSGPGFDPGGVPPPREGAAYGRGIHLVRNVCESLEYEGSGNSARATYVWQPGED